VHGDPVTSNQIDGHYNWWTQGIVSGIGPARPTPLRGRGEGGVRRRQQFGVPVADISLVPPIEMCKTQGRQGAGGSRDGDCPDTAPAFLLL
jgi:hypothetical protein